MRKVMLITGGGRGIGAATATLAAAAGYDVVVNYAGNAQRANGVVAEVEKAGRRAIAVQADVGVPEDVERLFRETDQAFGRLDAVVNSAGVTGPLTRIEALDTAGLIQLLNVNIAGTMLCCREAVRRMSTKNGGAGGSIVNISSRLAKLGGAGAYVPYSTSKAAIDTFTFGLAQEVAAEGIRVNAVSPGLIDTEIQPPGRVEAMTPQLPMRRAGQASEVASVIVWLCGDGASYVAGANINVSGAR